MVEPVRASSVRRAFLLTLFCCSLVCYTWYFIASYPLVSLDFFPPPPTDLRPAVPGPSSPSAAAPSISFLQHHHHQELNLNLKSSKPNWRPGDYAVKLWLPRRIKGRPETSNSQEDHRPLSPPYKTPSSSIPLSTMDLTSPKVNGSALGVLDTEDIGSTVKRLPQALIIGVKKCGTRALLEFLRIHPDVRATGPETHFFDRFYKRGLEWYRQQMPLSLEGQITMEKTPSYFITKEVPQRLYKMSPSLKLIVVVRDPVTRAISDYTQTASKRVTPSFDQMTFHNASTGLVDTSWSAIRIGVYSRFLDWWIRYFALEQVHFVSGENLVSDPAGEMSRVQDFLGLKRVITDKHFYFNETKGFPCLKKSEVNGNPHCLGKTKGRTHPDIPKSTISRLKDFYRPFNLRFYQMARRDFGWL